MIFSRATALRASSIARSVRPVRALRAAERQPWQRMLQQGGRRTYASAHGAATKTSDVPWMVGGALITVVGGYVVLTQDLGHGEGHDDHHDEKHDEGDEAPAEEESKDESKDGDSKDEKDDSDAKSKDPAESDPAGTQKAAKSTNETSGKQQGLSNDDTNHSTKIADNPDKSSKGEGQAETAKLKGTVSTDRPQK